MSLGLWPTCYTVSKYRKTHLLTVYSRQCQTDQTYDWCISADTDIWIVSSRGAVSILRFHLSAVGSHCGDRIVTTSSCLRDGFSCAGRVCVDSQWNIDFKSLPEQHQRPCHITVHWTLLKWVMGSCSSHALIFVVWCLMREYCLCADTLWIIFLPCVPYTKGNKNQTINQSVNLQLLRRNNTGKQINCLAFIALASCVVGSSVAMISRLLPDAKRVTTSCIISLSDSEGNCNYVLRGFTQVTQFVKVRFPLALRRKFSPMKDKCKQKVFDH